MCRRAVLREWKSQHGLRATYRLLLELFVAAEHVECAGILCDHLRERGDGEAHSTH
jgi:hypothetical protein